MRRTLKEVLSEYGRVALVVYLVIFAAVLLGSWAAIHLGWRPEGAAGSIGTFGAAYLFTKLTQPLRIGATVVLTPLLARAHERFVARRGGGARAARTGDPVE